MRCHFVLENRKQLEYDRSQTPCENVMRFFESVKVMIYVWDKVEIDGKVMPFLDSAWQNDLGLKDITKDFQEEFLAHLIDFSMSHDKYSVELRTCKSVLHTINLFYAASTRQSRIHTRPDRVQDLAGVVKFESLPVEYRVMIDRCYELFAVFFRHLQEIIQEEEKDFERKEYVRVESSYEWTGEKNDFSELALALFASGAVKVKGTRKFMPSRFARELAAFFDIDKLNFDQDIDQISARPLRKRGEFIEKCLRQLEKAYDDRDRTKKK